MERKSAALIGATGLIGSHLLTLLIDDAYFSSIRVVVRRPLPIAHPKVQVLEIDFTDRVAFREALSGSNAVFCAVGTTQKKVKGNKEAYRKVDYDIPVTAARLCEENGVQQFLLVSSIGANSNSNTFYTRLKGEVEEAVKQMKIGSVAVFRPSLLLGSRKEVRIGEKIGELLMKPLSFLLPARYKPIPAAVVAKAMLKASKQSRPGFAVYHYSEMISM